ncbi:DUF3299 domain-containing protein [Alginatibacterium sediminis]|uniref:DUF3299 domain-containing protein n=1 Tax=Alginatibacterium sediminis TaxID=2164068 RepID=A0A420E6B0_9ALTE|nr:DUF3299 domain-containing protein [Alginatibacterium sediminis]RKF13278.1 DUF3299 domain-containing protein [Alginatibacterium sediminis]
MKKILINLCLLLPLFANADADIWEQLIPENERMQSQFMPQQSHDNIATQSAVVSINKDIVGKDIRIPGFVVPLETKGELITEFLLVPYMGACIHYPPPPANQIVYVQSDEGVMLEDIWEPVWIEGRLETQMHYVDDMQATSAYIISQPKSVTLYTQ